MDIKKLWLIIIIQICIIVTVGIILILVISSGNDKVNRIIDNKISELEDNLLQELNLKLEEINNNVKITFKEIETTIDNYNSDLSDLYNLFTGNSTNKSTESNKRVRADNGGTPGTENSNRMGKSYRDNIPNSIRFQRGYKYLVQ